MLAQPLQSRERMEHVNDPAKPPRGHQDPRSDVTMVGPQVPQRRPVATSSQEPPPSLTSAPLIASLGQESEKQLRDNSQPDKERLDNLLKRQKTALRLIYDAVCKAKRQLTGTSLDDVLYESSYPEQIYRASVDIIGQVENLDAKLKTIERKATNAVEELRKQKTQLAEVERERNKAEGAAAAFKDVIKDKDARISQLISSASRLDEHVKDMGRRHAEDRAQLKNVHDGEKEELRKKLGDERTGSERKLKYEANEKIRGLNEQLSTIKSKRDERKEKLRKEIEGKKDDEIRKLEAVKDKEIQSLRTQYKNAMNGFETEKSRFQASRNTMVENHANELARVKEEMKGKVSRLETDKHSAEIQHQNHVDSIYQANRNEMDMLEQKHTEDMRAKDEWFATERSDYDQRHMKSDQGPRTKFGPT